MSDDQNAVIGLLTNLARDTGQIKTDLAVNTTKTTAIEDHLRIQNGRVLKLETLTQQLSKEEEENTKFRQEAEKTNLKRRDRMWDFLDKLLWALLPIIAIGLWQVFQYLLAHGAFS